MLHITQNEKDEKRKSQLSWMLFYITHELIYLNWYMPTVNDNTSILAFKYSIIRMRSGDDGNLYQLCLMDSWYGLLIKPHLPGIADQKTETVLYVDESIVLITSHILHFFDFVNINGFSQKPNLSRHFNMKALFEGQLESNVNLDLRDLRGYPENDECSLGATICLNTEDTIKYLDLSHNNFNDIEVLSEILMAIPEQITTIDISHSKLNDLSACDIESIKSSTPHLNTVYVSYDELNKMTTDQLQALKKLFSTQKIVTINNEGKKIDNDFFIFSTPNPHHYTSQLSRHSSSPLFFQNSGGETADDKTKTPSKTII